MESPFTFGAPELLTLLAALHASVRAHATILYIPELTQSGWEVRRCEWLGEGSCAGTERLRKHVLAAGLHGAAFGRFQPHLVPEDQRNQLVTATQLAGWAPPGSCRVSLRASLGLAHCDQLRVLVCDGLRLLGWLGVLREAPFTAAEHAAFKRAIAPVQRCLLSERYAAQPLLTHSLLGAVLSSIEEPVLIVSEPGRIEYANTAAATWLECGAGQARLLQLGAALQSASADLDLHVHPLEVNERERWQLVRVVKSKLRSLQLRDGERHVLDLVLSGLSNKEIATRLGCAEVTVERRLTRIFRLAGVGSRMQLMALVYR